MPYSKWHNYKKFVNDIKNDKIDSYQFNNFHKVNLKNIIELPYAIDDVFYNSINIELDTANETRFHKGTKRIYL